MNQLFRNFISKERVNSFRELTKTLVKMAGTDEVVPEEDESVPWALAFLFVFLPILNGMDELWKQPQRKRDLQELMAIAKRAVAVLKEYDYDNLDDVVDAEVVINEYTERYGL